LEEFDSLMGMRRIAITAIFMLVALSVAGSASAARGGARTPSKCPSGRSHLITADAQAQVYLRPEGSGPSGFEAEEIFGCAYGSKRSFAISGPPTFSAEGGGEATHYTLAGAILAYASLGVELVPPPGITEWKVVVENLSNGRVLHEVPTGTTGAPATTSAPGSIRTPRHVGVGPVVSLVVKSDGAAAWIVENEIPARHVPAEYEVHAVDKTGNMLLASGSNIDPHSLALAGSTLYWTQEGKPKSAALN
jgi:hypothetical protein